MRRAGGASSRSLEFAPRGITVNTIYDTWVATMIETGMPEAAAKAYVSLGASQRAGYAGVVADTVERLTGKAPTSLRDILAAHSDQFAQPTV